jgi:hypothetical protein
MPSKGWFLVLGGAILLWSQMTWAKPAPSQILHLQVPILGTSLTPHHLPMGLVSNIDIDIFERRDQDGLRIQFHTEPGQFSLLARKSIHHAITQALQAADLPVDSWTVQLKFPYAGLTVYGESLSAMVGLSVVAMVKGDPLLDGRILTGTITDQGTIGAVGGLQLKILAAYRHAFQRVFVPSVYDERDGDWQTPFLMQVSPVGTVEEAYEGLTGHQLHAGPIGHSFNSAGSSKGSR